MFQGMRNLCCKTIIHKHSNTKQTECANVAYVCFSDNGNDDIDDTHAYEMKCNKWKPNT